MNLNEKGVQNNLKHYNNAKKKDSISMSQKKSGQYLDFWSKSGKSGINQESKHAARPVLFKSTRSIEQQF